MPWCRPGAVLGPASDDQMLCWRHRLQRKLARSEVGTDAHCTLPLRVTSPRACSAQTSIPVLSGPTVDYLQYQGDRDGDRRCLLDSGTYHRQNLPASNDTLLVECSHSLRPWRRQGCQCHRKRGEGEDTLVSVTLGLSSYQRNRCAAPVAAMRRIDVFPCARGQAHRQPSWRTVHKGPARLVGAVKQSRHKLQVRHSRHRDARLGRVARVR